MRSGQLYLPGEAFIAVSYLTVHSPGLLRKEPCNHEATQEETEPHFAVSIDTVMDI